MKALNRFLTMRYSPGSGSSPATISHPGVPGTQ